MKLSTAIFFLMFAQISYAQILEPDKVAHLAVSYAVANTSTTLMQNTDHPILYSFAIGMIPGLIKRVYDNTKVYDAMEKNQDMLANIIGAASGSLIGNWVIKYSNTKTFTIAYRKNF